MMMKLLMMMDHHFPIPKTHKNTLVRVEIAAERESESEERIGLVTCHEGRIGKDASHLLSQAAGLFVLTLLYFMCLSCEKK